jgi:hypothetical protein
MNTLDLGLSPVAARSPGRAWRKSMVEFEGMDRYSKVMEQK